MQNQTAVLRAVQASRRASCGLVDCLIAEISADEGCTQVATFDKKTAKYPGYALLKV